MSINYNKNEYIRLEKSGEEIYKDIISGKMTFYIYIKTDLEELEIDGIKEPDTLIYFKSKTEINFRNIYYSVRTIIIDEEVIIDRWMEIPEEIENIIVVCCNKDVYLLKNNKSKLDFIHFNNKKRQKEIIDEMVLEGRELEENKLGRAPISYLLYSPYEEKEIIKILDKKDEEYKLRAISYLIKISKNPDFIIEFSSYEKNDKIIERLDKEIIEKIIEILKFYDMKQQYIEDIRLIISKIKKENIPDKILLIVCDQKFKDWETYDVSIDEIEEIIKLIIMLKEKGLDRKIFNIINDRNATPLILLLETIENSGYFNEFINYEKIILEIIGLMDDEYINKATNDKFFDDEISSQNNEDYYARNNPDINYENYTYGRTILYYACKYKMLKVAKEMIKRGNIEMIKSIDEKGRTALYFANSTKLNEYDFKYKLKGIEIDVNYFNKKIEKKIREKMK
jgi:hypothetical protein